MAFLRIQHTVGEGVTSLVDLFPLLPSLALSPVVLLSVCAACSRLLYSQGLRPGEASNVAAIWEPSVCLLIWCAGV